MSGDPTATCGCCEPLAAQVPLPIGNRPGLEEIGYRIGTFSSFRATMLDRIARAEELERLTTRRSDDYAIAVLELWAAVADILTFYQERYANEAFLRTATRRESIGRLARLIDYRLRPGVSAAAELSFEVQDGKRVTVPAGSRVQSVPEGEEQAQVFETSAPLVADARLNRLRAYGRPRWVEPLGPGQREAAVVPTAPFGGGLSAGDRVLLVRAPTPPSRPPRIPFLRRSATLVGLLPSPLVAPETGPVDSLIEEKEIASVSSEEWRTTIAWTTPVAGEFAGHRARAFVRKRVLRLFGHDAPAQVPEPEQIGDDGVVRWKLTPVSRAYGGQRRVAGGDDRAALDLDGSLEGIEPGGLLLVRDPDRQSTIVRVRSVERVSRSLPGGPPRAVTRVEVSPRPDAIPDVSRASVYELGPRIELDGRVYEPPRPAADGAVFIPGPLAEEDGEAVVLAGAERRGGRLSGGTPVGPADFSRGARVLLRDAAGAVGLAMVAGTAAIEGLRGFGHLRVPLLVVRDVDLDPATAVLLGNVAAATHGESVRAEPLGEAAPGAALPLPRSPLAYLPSSGPAGVESTLEVRVGEVAWREVPRLYGQGPRERVYEVDRRPEGEVAVRFGDGEFGAPPPPGRLNATASYRVGGGLVGRVPAGSLQNALDRPPGLLEVTNPGAAYGGADAEPPGEARGNAPHTVRTFGRAVALRDFEDLVRADGEVAKASAVRTWDGRVRAVHVTVAGDAGGVFPPDQLRRIGEALAAAASPGLRVRVANYATVPVRIRATLRTAPERDPEAVVDAARQAALAALSFEALEIGQALHLSRVYAVLQAVEGVAAVDVDELAFADADLDELRRRGAELLPGGAVAPLQPHLRIFGARPDPTRPGRVLAGELATVATPAEDLVIRAEELE